MTYDFNTQLETIFWELLVRFIVGFINISYDLEII